MTSVDGIAAGATLLDRVRRSLGEQVFTCRARSLFMLAQALAGGGAGCGCPAHASLGAAVGHAAFYRALREGEVDARALVGVAMVAARGVGAPRVYAIDTTAVPRPNAPTSPDRQPQHTPGGSRSAAWIVVGWRYQQVVRLTLTPDSWTVPVVVDRVASDQDPVELALEQIAAVCAADGATPQDPSLFLLDSGYPAARITHVLRQRHLPAQVLVRLSTSQVFWTRPQVRAAHRLGGRPRRHGLRLSVGHPDLPAPSVVSAPVAVYGQITVAAWHQVHPKLDAASRGFEHLRPAPIVEGTVLHVRVQHLRPARRAGDLALWYSGNRSDLLTLVMTYLARFDVEHYFRFLKTTARIGAFHPMQPGTYTTWLRLHACAYLQLLAARGQVAGHRLPWEPAWRVVLSPGQVRRQVSPALANAWQPPAPAKPSHPGPGRPPARRRRRRERHKIVRKTAIHKGK